MNHHFKSQRYWRARLFLFLFIFIATVSSALAEEGYWVLVKSEIQENDAGISHNGSGKSTKRLWNIRKNWAQTSEGGVTMTWQDPPSKIRFGDEDNITFTYERHFDSGLSDQALKAMKALYQLGASISSSYASAYFIGDGHVFRIRDHFPSENINPGKDTKMIIMVSARMVQPGTAHEIAVRQIYHYVYRGPGQLMEKTTEATDKEGEEEEGTEIPWIYIVGGGIAVAGGAALIGKKKKPKTGKTKKESRKEEKKEEEDEKKHSRYRMLLYKDFGDTLSVGDPPQVIGA